jgi:alpha-L-rhamnosidase
MVTKRQQGLTEAATKFGCRHGCRGGSALSLFLAVRMMIGMMMGIIFACQAGEPIFANAAARAKGQQTMEQIPDTRGPVVTPGMRVHVAQEGVQTVGYRFVNHCVKPSPWQAQWVWLRNAQAEKQPLAALFRKEVELTSLPLHVDAWLSADVRYRLYVNGKPASRGPADIGRDYDGTRTGKWFYDYRDLTPLFHKGKNVIAAEVYSEAVFNSDYSSGHPGFLFEAEMSLPGRKRLTVKTDETWQSIPADFLRITQGGPNGQNQGELLEYDGTREPVGWQTDGFTTDAWPSCAPTTATRPPLVASELPPLMEARYPALEAVRVSPGIQAVVGKRSTGNGSQLTLPATSVAIPHDGSFSIHYDRVLSAYIGLKVKGVAGAMLTLMPNEPNAPGWHRMARMVLRDGIQVFELPFYDSFSVINIEARNVSAPIEIEDISADFVSYPVSYKGHFACSDPELNRIWQSCRWATQICMQTHHLDSPHHQEPISDPGDYLIESLINYYTFDEPWLARQDLRKYGWVLEQCHNHNFHTSYALLWLQMLLDYYDYTGDAALVKELAPIVHSLLATWESYRGKNGLISEAPNYMFMDWVEIAGFQCHHPPAVIGQGYMTALYYRALLDGMRVARLQDDEPLAARYEERRERTRVAFARELWNPAKGQYRDGKPFQTSVTPGQWLPADREIETFSPHVNTFAVLYDLAPPERQGALLDTLLHETPLNCQPYFMHFVFAALQHGRRFEAYALEQMKRWQIVADTQTFREMWDTGDLSHGWIATPLYQMMAVILGVTPLAPGYAEARIAPQPCQLAWVRGEVPTAHGPIKVNWRKAPDAFHLEITVPTGTVAEVALPITTDTRPTVIADGRTVWHDDRPTAVGFGLAPLRKSADALTVRVAAGTYRFLVTVR